MRIEMRIPKEVSVTVLKDQGNLSNAVHCKLLCPEQLELTLNCNEAMQSLDLLTSVNNHTIIIQKNKRPEPEN